MFDILKQYRLTLVINVVLLSLFIFFNRPLSSGRLLFISVCEIIFLVLFVVTHFRSANNTNWIQCTSDTVIIHGVFKEYSIPKREVREIRLGKNLLCKILDWTLVKIQTTSKTLTVYTKAIAQDSKFWN